MRSTYIEGTSGSAIYLWGIKAFQYLLQTTLLLRLVFGLELLERILQLWERCLGPIKRRNIDLNATLAHAFSIDFTLCKALEQVVLNVPNVLPWKPPARSAWALWRRILLSGVLTLETEDSQLWRSRWFVAHCWFEFLHTKESYKRAYYDEHITSAVKGCPPLFLFW